MYKADNHGDLIMLGLVNRLRETMQEKSVNLSTLSRRSGVSKATISRILNKKTYPNFGTIYKLYRTLGEELKVELLKRN